MKNRIFSIHGPLCVLAAILFTAPAPLFAVDLLDESFETDGEGTRYRSNTHTDGANDFFERHDFATDNPHPSHATAVTAVDGSFAWAGEDVDTSDNPLGSGMPGIVRLDDLTVTGHNNLKVIVALGFSPQVAAAFEAADSIQIQAAFDGNSGGTGSVGALTSGSYTTVGRFLGNTVDGDGLVQDTNLNGVLDGGETTQLSATLTDFMFDISGVGGLAATGDALSIQVVAAVGGNEEIVFDHIRVTGDVTATDPPTLTGIEGSTIDYTEGDGMTQVTNTIIVGDPDSAMLTGGTVQVLGGVPAEDSLAGADSGGVTIAGGGTNTLTLSGTATLAAYQTVLRSITYQNTNLTNPSTMQRTISFVVNDGVNFSGAATRMIDVTGTVAAQTIPHTEDLNTDGEGVRYTSNSFSVGDDYFERTDANPHPHHTFPYGFTAPQDGGYFASEDVDTSDNPLGAGQPGIFRLPNLDSSGLVNLSVSVFLAENNDGTNLEPGDSIEIQAAFDGSVGGTDLTSGTYTTIGRFIGDGAGLRQDTNLDGSSTDPADAGMSPALLSTFAEHTFNILGTGNILSVQIVVNGTSGNEEVAFDHIRVNGVVAGNPPVLADIEATPLGFTEGDAATQITDTITATDSDSVNLEGATIQITTGYQNGEDELAVNGALPAGISDGGFVAGTGTLTLTGSAPVADYQAALRQITYQNTNTSNPSVCDRTVNFQVTDGTSMSILQSRTIAITGFVPTGTLPYLEDFDSDGDGTRYTSNSFTDGGGTPSDYFERTDTNPHPGHPSAFTMTAPQGNGFWAAEDLTNAINKLTDQGIVRLPDLQTAGYTDLQVSLYLAQIAATLEASDQIEVQYAFDANRGGTDLNAGTYTTVGRFIGSGTNTALRQDSDLDGSSSDAEDAASPTLSSTMTEYTFDLSGTGDWLSVQIKVTQDGGNEEFGFDHIQVTGTAQPEIDVQRPAATSIADGGSDDLGDVDLGTQTVTYTIDNTAGVAQLDVTSVGATALSNVSGFSTLTGLPLNIAAGGTSTLQIQFDTDASGAFGFDLDIVSNDADEATYDIAVSGSVPNVDIALSQTESADPLTAGAGGTLTYEVTAMNDGPGNATGVTVTETLTLPDGVTIASITPSAGTSYSSPTWTIGALANSGSATLTIVLNVSTLVPTGTNIISSTAALASVNETDGNAANDSSAVSTSIDGNSLQDWRTSEFAGADLVDAGKEATVWGNTADPDGDCLTNIFEFLFGTDPNTFDLAPPVTLGTTGSTFATIDFTKRIDLTGVTLAVHVSSNRAAGFGASANAPATAPIDATFETITYTDDLGVASGAPRFIKIILSQGGTDYESETYGTSCLPVKPHTATTPGTLTFMGLQWVRPKTADGTVTGSGVNTLTDSNALWPVDSLIGYYVRITSGTDEGVMADITSNTATELTLSDDLSAFTINGETYEIRAHTEIEDLFGTNNAAGLGAGDNSTTADNIIVIAPGGAEQTIFYSSTDALWRDNSFSDVTDQPVMPEQGFIVRRRVNAASALYLQGALLNGKKTAPVEQGFNLVGTIKSNTALTLDGLGLFTDNPATGVAKGLNPLVSDNLLIFNADGSTSLYFYLDFGGSSGWVNDAYAPSGTVSIAPGSSFYLNRRAANPAFNWTIPAE